MTDLSIRLSAYLDGELTDADALAIEALLESDPELRAELDALMAADASAQAQFDSLLAEPVPLALAQRIKSAAAGVSAKPAQRRPVWGALAAGLLLFIAGGASGYLIYDRAAPGTEVARAGWLNDIADYHAIYSGQKRHLVEVAANESDHIKTWLGSTVGVPFSIPDLSAFGLTFEGGRLLVANGRPVAQLMYRQADGAVVALCFQSSTGAASAPGFKAQTIKGFDLVSWKAGAASYVVIGPEGRRDLTDIAALASKEV
ncbi:anti-sigma factor RsiW [Hoeflea marina]|uniref:Anti-sigma factor RsiW n=1 Tax=Hoeflea marina TaxID=274592 RepID=A0A317PUZ2_9HYPH|nr:anti-sigma factor [Hoeflea marina]PWW04505.1 anti-sigma factor RsiW [Hoeflea marina]